MSATLTVLVPGLQTTVQDLGRWGYQALGVPVAGPMDPFSHRLANALVGNSRDAATLEVTLTGPTVRFGDARVFAVAGALFDLTVDRHPIAHGRALAVGPGAVLAFGERRSGARAYLAVAGGFDAPRLLGSRATHVPTRMGGWLGRALTRGDVLPLGAPRSSKAAVRAQRTGERNDVPIPLTTPVRILPGPQDDRFVSDAIRTLTLAPYVVGMDSNRMGFRLEGASLRHLSGPDIISDATAPGSLQVPGSGQPVLLMADRQTTGGYALLATVITADFGVAGQAAPGDRIQFATCTRAEALGALVARERRLLAIEAST